MEKIIVCVHGRGQDWKIKDTLESTWYNALKFGIERCGGEPFTLHKEKVVLAHYGDLFRPDGYDGSKGDFEEEADDNFVEELAEQMIQEAHMRSQIDRVALESSLSDIGGRGEKGWGRRAKPLLRMVDCFPGVPDFFVSLRLKDVGRYLKHSDFRQAVIDRVVAVLQHCRNQEIILVAQSLGTVVAYDTINTHPELPVSAFITLGSLFGFQTSISKNLLADENQLRNFPLAITGNWYNFYDSDDPFVLTHDLAPLFMRLGNPQIISTEVINGGYELHHAATDYLSSKAVGRTLRTLFNISSAC